MVSAKNACGTLQTEPDTDKVTFNSLMGVILHICIVLCENKRMCKAVLPSLNLELFILNNAKMNLQSVMQKKSHK